MKFIPATKNETAHLTLQRFFPAVARHLRLRDIISSSPVVRPDVK
jgi:hypothetical protein